MPAILPHLQKAPFELQQLLCLDGAESFIVLAGAIGLCCALLFYTRKRYARKGAASMAGDENNGSKQGEKSSGRDGGYVWSTAGYPTPTVHPMYTSAETERPLIGGQTRNSTEIRPSEMLPVRRTSYTSYTKYMGEVGMQGEIMFGDGWTRHTRVYGGGVCLACEDSKKKQSIMGVGMWRGTAMATATATDTNTQAGQSN